MYPRAVFPLGFAARGGKQGGKNFWTGGQGGIFPPQIIKMMVLVLFFLFSPPQAPPNAIFRLKKRFPFDFRSKSDVSKQISSFQPSRPGGKFRGERILRWAARGKSPCPPCRGDSGNTAPAASPGIGMLTKSRRKRSTDPEWSGLRNWKCRWILPGSQLSLQFTCSESRFVTYHDIALKRFLLNSELQKSRA